MTRLIAILATVALVAFLGAVWVVTEWRGDDRFAQCRSSAVAGGGQIGGPFTLIDGTGQTVTERDILTKPSLVYFGYTFCPDVCPLDTARNADATDLLLERGYDVQPVFITIDPARDTPEVMADFAANMHPDMIGLSGSEAQIAAASKAYRTYYKKQESDDPDYYLVDHSRFTYLMLPESGFAEFYGGDVSAEQLADSAACFIDAS